MVHALRPGLDALADEADDLLGRLGDLPVQAGGAAADVEAEVARAFPLDGPRAPAAIVRDGARLLRAHAVHVFHPRYFGLFNPPVRDAAILGDALAALYNPQLAARSHAAAASAMERHVLRTLGALAGFPDPEGAFFTSGGAEANLSAVAVALARAFPRACEEGLGALGVRPVLYVSGEAHDSFVKIARLTGLGTGAVRRVPTVGLRMDPRALAAAIAEDRAAGRAPLLVAATAGTTAAGAIDPVAALGEVARAEGLWLHVDAAWGALALLSPATRGWLAGVERADSLTWDAHKTLAAPMGAGMFFCREPALLLRAFGVQATYMPVQGVPAEPFTTTPQWSRRAIGVKVLFALAETGLPALAAETERQVALGRSLRARLAAAGFRLVNDTPLPLACFAPEGWDAPDAAERLKALALRVQGRGRAWVSFAVVGGAPCLRACVVGFRTGERDVEALVAELRDAVSGAAAGR
jgi:glutamate/tyrosine decarboxylase-like PLP-dependent enzyme